jgi:hypothetical protein
MMLTRNEDFISNLKKDDIIYYAEYESGKNEIKIKSLKIKELYGKKDHIEGIKTDAFLCDLVDTEFPKVTIRKTDISRGYFKTEKEAAQAFTDVISEIYDACKRIIAKL